MEDQENGKLIVVSNAGPYKHVKTADGYSVEEVGGGLASSLKNLLRQRGGVWISKGRTDADEEVIDENGIVEDDFSPERSFDLKRICVEEDVYRGFYEGWSNQAIWPNFHNMPERAIYRKQWWEDYKKVNRVFARSILEHYEEGDFVFIQDYHLMLVPEMVRSELPNARIGAFLHIPFPPIETFEQVVNGDKMLEGISSSDLVGVHLDSYKQNFLDNIRNLGDSEVEGESFSFRGKHSEIDSFPLGIDTESWNPTEDYFEPDSEELAAVKRTAEKVKSQRNVDKIILGVDRLDYTKDIDKKFKGIGRFFEKYPEYRGDVLFVQISQGSRKQIPEYQDYRKKLNGLVGEINSKFAELKSGWRPIEFYYGGVSGEELDKWYHAADIGLITPRIDGMNLVSKEFVASNPVPKVEILSKFAGAHEQLGDGVISTNHVDREGDNLAEAVRKAVEMEEDEKRRRWKKLRREVFEEDIDWWWNSYSENFQKATDVKQNKESEAR